MKSLPPAQLFSWRTEGVDGNIHTNWLAIYSTYTTPYPWCIVKGGNCFIGPSGGEGGAGPTTHTTLADYIMHYV